ncbi:MAG: hypothetical protein AAGD05_09180, partial [Bacteroidota bacterium]
LSVAGVPLGAAFGLADYAQIGYNGVTKWTAKWNWSNKTTATALANVQNLIGRWPIKDKAFRHDPGPFFLAKTANQLQPEQQYTLLLLYTLLGEVWLCADLVEDYSAEQWSEWNSILKWKGSQVEHIEQVSPLLYYIYFHQQSDQFVAICNLSTKKVIAHLRKRQYPLEAMESWIVKS